MPVEFLTDEQAAAYGRFTGPPSRAELDRCFHLDGKALGLIEPKRRPHNRLGCALQLTTVHYLGTFLADPTNVPTEVTDYLAVQLGISDPSCVKAYREREMTRLQHAREIRDAYGFSEFTAAEAELTAWIDAQSWTSGDGPKALFDAAAVWLRERKVLLPGVTTLARLVARVRDQANQRLWDTLAGLATPEQRRTLAGLLRVSPGERLSDLERLRRGPTRVSGPALVKALDRVAELAGMGIAGLDLSGVPPRRVAELARYGLAGKATLLGRYGDARKLATLLATITKLRVRAVDDALELLDVLMATRLLAAAEREDNKQKLRRLRSTDRASAKLATAVKVLFAASEREVPPSLEEVWAQIEAAVPRGELAAALEVVTEFAPPLDAEATEAWRGELVRRYATVRPFLEMLTEVITFGATPEGAPLLAAMRGLPALLARKKVRAEEIDGQLVPAAWRRLVYAGGARTDADAELEPGTIDRRAYVFCVLEQFHRHLRRRDIYARDSDRWGDPRARLLDGQAWERVKATTLTALKLPEDPDGLLAGHASRLRAAYQEVAARLPANTAVSVDDDGRLHLAALTAEQEPPSLVDLRERVRAMLPRVDLPELLLEVMGWVPTFPAAFTPVLGGEPRLAGLHVSLAAVLTGNALNIGFAPIVKRGVEALERDRLSHVDQNYLRPETIAAANAPLIAAQDDVDLARAWGGGLVASVDGMRFVVPVRTIHARPNPRYFHQGVGVTWLNAVNDQAAGIAGMVVSGTPRDSMHLIDLLYSQDGGVKPEVIITDTGSYSDIVFGLVHLLGRQYRPELADLPDQKLWRVGPPDGYGALEVAARGRINLERARRHWPDVLRVVASIHTGAVRAYDVLRVLQRDSNPTPLGDAIANYGRIFKSLHVLAYVDDPPYRRHIKGMRNLVEGRHSLARKLFHGQKGELRQRYHEGMEDQLGVLGLVLNCVVLWNTVYMDAALAQLRQQGYPVEDADVARLSPFVRKHLNVHGRYTFQLPELPGGRRPLRDPDQPDDEDDE